LGIEVEAVSVKTSKGGFLGVGLGISSKGPADIPFVLNRFSKNIGYLQYYASTFAGFELEPQEFRENISQDLPVTIHASGIDIATAFPVRKAIISSLNNIVNVFEAKWIVEDVAYWFLGKNRKILGSAYIDPLLTLGTLRQCIRKYKRVSKMFSVPFLPEIPSFNHFVGGDMTVMDFFNAFIKETKAPYVLDLGHFFAYSWLKKINHMRAIEKLDVTNVMEIHLPGGVFKKKNGVLEYAERHEARVISEYLELLEYVMPKTPNLKGVLIENHNATEEVIGYNIDEVTKIVKKYR
jgi:uncharacterized protein (UPF0276 family)